MKTQGLLSARSLLVLAVKTAALGGFVEAALAGPKQSVTAASSARHCRADEEAFTVLKVTTIEAGVRVDYEFVRFGQASWTNMNRPLLRQFGVRVGATICLPRGPVDADTTDFD